MALLALPLFPYLHTLPPIGELLGLEEQVQVQDIGHPYLQVELVHVPLQDLQGQELGAMAAALAPLEVVEVVELPVPLAPARDVRP